MNNNLIEFLKKEIDEKKISHAFLVETNSSDTLINEITNLLTDQQIIPNKSLENNISVSIIKPENNLIDKNKILDLQKFIMTKSVVNEYKIYFIINAELMNLSSFNKLLKVLEEPAENVIGFLITDNMNQIISTIKSRCKRFKITYNIEEEIKEDNKLDLEMLINIKKLTFEEILNLKKSIMSKEKTSILTLLTEYKQYLASNISITKDIRMLANSYKILDNIIESIKSNVNLELCLDKMFIEMRK